jgi:hypothetical protein
VIAVASFRVVDVYSLYLTSFTALCNIAVGGKEALQTLLRNLYAPVPIIGRAYGNHPPFSFCGTLCSLDPQLYPQFFEMVLPLQAFIC